jgi:hypothetical protein
MDQAVRQLGRRRFHAPVGRLTKGSHKALLCNVYLGVGPFQL